MATINCVFDIISADGGDLKGDMFGPTTGRLRRGDSLVVKVNWKAAAQAPNNLLGRLMISASPTASSSQVFASPFLQPNNRQLCFSQPIPANLNGGSYTFAPLTVAADRPDTVLGKYELTFVAEDPSAQTQWSEDPEFDVEG